MLRVVCVCICACVEGRWGGGGGGGWGGSTQQGGCMVGCGRVGRCVEPPLVLCMCVEVLSKGTMHPDHYCRGLPPFLLPLSHATQTDTAALQYSQHAQGIVMHGAYTPYAWGSGQSASAMHVHAWSMACKQLYCMQYSHHEQCMFMRGM